MKYNYDLKGDITSFLESINMNLEDFAKNIGFSRQFLSEQMNDPSNNELLEQVYDFIYKNKFLLNEAKNELLIETKSDDSILLYHGSRYGLESIDFKGSKKNADFSNGFYLSLSLDSAINFVEDIKYSSVYVFEAFLDDLDIIEFKCDEEWMLLICYFRGYLEEYKNSPLIKKLLNKIKDKDLIIAPIADNKMYQILGSFASGMISSSVAMHSLSASRLGNQYVFKSKKGISRLKFLSRFYISTSEREDVKKESKEQASLISSKLNLAKRIYKKEGKFIDEIL